MRAARWKADKNEPVAHYHCISRVVERRYAFGGDEKEHFIHLMRGYEAFCGVRVVTAEATRAYSCAQAIATTRERPSISA